MSEYILLDRTTVGKYVLTISNGELNYSITDSDSQQDIIVEDISNGGNDA